MQSLYSFEPTVSIRYESPGSAQLACNAQTELLAFVHLEHALVNARDSHTSIRTSKAAGSTTEEIQSFGLISEIFSACFEKECKADKCRLLDTFVSQPTDLRSKDGSSLAYL